MDISGFSLLAKEQIACGRSESGSMSKDNSSSGGWKYITVVEGDIEYTYIVIGKDMKILVGTTSVHEDKNKDKDKDTNKDKKATGVKENSADKSDELNEIGKNKMEANKVDFLTDLRMIGMTAFYQKKIQQTIENMEAHIGTAYCGRDRVDEVDAKEKVKKIQMGIDHEVSVPHRS